MRKKEEIENPFTTLDSYLAGWLVSKKHTPQLIEQGNKIVFYFNASDELFQDLDEYNAGAMIEASRFAFLIKGLKSRIHSLRKKKGSYEEGSR
jgi:hypothetical protein